MTELTLPHPQVWHTLRYHDAPAAIDFLTTVFGFRLIARYDNADDPTKVDHAQLHWPEAGSGIMIGSDRESDEWPASAGHAACYVSTDDVKSIYRRVTDAGFRLVSDLKSDEYDPGTDTWSFSVADPEGNLWSFGSYRGEPIPLD